MNVKIFNPFIIIIILSAHFMYAQNSSNKTNLQQTIRGKVLEDNTLIPIIGATVIVNSDKEYYTTTNNDGSFSLEVPTGIISIKISYVGYQTYSASNISLNSGKQLVLDIKLSESLEYLEEVSVYAFDRGKSRNVSALVSSRTVSMEEVNKYAGAFNDVARMATNFAGVSGNDDSTNDLVIRGNAPGGLLWRIDDIDVFNPNHYGDAAGTGGPVSMVNSNTLANSDFFTGAFPASYGNALSGVFDLNLRNGNDQKHEFTGQIAFSGFELGAEGPFSKNSKASYLVNARYSVLDFVHQLGIGSGTGTAIPQYTDITAKINIPTEKAGNFSMFFIGGINSIKFDAGESGTYYSGQSNEALHSYGGLALTGFSHFYSFNSKTHYKASISYQYSQNNADLDTLNILTNGKDFTRGNDFNRQRINASVYVNHKFSSKTNLKTGIRLNNDFFDLKSFARIAGEDRYQINDSGLSFSSEAYAEVLYKPLSWLSIAPGLNFKYLFLNNTYGVDPRLSVELKLAPNHELKIGYGLHSQLQPINIYKATPRQSNTDLGEFNNLDLELTKAHHFVLSYNWRILPSLRFMTEVYYQHLFDVPVSINPNSTFSIVNFSTFDLYNELEQLTNKGKGRNYGIELTIEKFLGNGWYTMLNGSLFSSEYKTLQNIWYNTAFNANYLVNALGGKEFRITDNFSIFSDAKVLYSGGKRYTAIKTDNDGKPIFNSDNTLAYDYENSYDSQTIPYFRLDFKIGAKLNLGKTAHEWAFDCRNITNRKNIFNISYDSKGNLQTTYQQGIFPMGLYRIYF